MMSSFCTSSISEINRKEYHRVGTADIMYTIRLLNLVRQLWRMDKSHLLLCFVPNGQMYVVCVLYDSIMLYKDWK